MHIGREEKYAGDPETAALFKQMLQLSRQIRNTRWTEAILQHPNLVFS
jgi:hypothetical protein